MTVCFTSGRSPVAIRLLEPRLIIYLLISQSAVNLLYMDNKQNDIKILKPQSNYVKKNFQECRTDTKYSSSRLRQGINWRYPHRRLKSEIAHRKKAFAYLLSCAIRHGTWIVQLGSTF